MSIDRLMIGDLRVAETTTGIGSPALELSVGVADDGKRVLDAREVRELRDELSDWLRERGRE